jgi:hypothetical protein
MMTPPRASDVLPSARASAALVVAALAAFLAACQSQRDSRAGATHTESAAASVAEADAGRGCAADNGGLTLADGFCAAVFADSLGHARHLTVSPSGVVYVNTWSGEYYGNAPLPKGGFAVENEVTLQVHLELAKEE